MSEDARSKQKRTPEKFLEKALVESARTLLAQYYTFVASEFGVLLPQEAEWRYVDLVGAKWGEGTLLDVAAVECKRARTVRASINAAIGQATDYQAKAVRDATQHHYVAERFFGRSTNRPGTFRAAIFACCPWGCEGSKGLFCYECHEELLHNPVLLPHDVERLATLVKMRGLDERGKPADRSLIAARIALLHEVLEEGLMALLG